MLPAKLRSTNTFSESKMSSPPKRGRTSRHSTIISAPVDVAWESLCDIHSWRWNPCVRLRSSLAKEGVSGKAIVYHEGKWKAKPFTFHTVDRKNFTFSWSTKYDSCLVKNTMTLTRLSSKRTHLTHTQEFEGLKSILGLPMGHRRLAKTMKKYACVMSEGLKNHVESMYFRELLLEVSNRDFSIIDERASSESTISTDFSSDASAAHFWQTPKHLREQVAQTLVDQSLDDPVSKVEISHSEYE